MQHLKGTVMNTAKPWYLSKTIWASIVTILMSVGGMFGLPDGLVDNGALADTILQAVTALMGLVSIFGRVTAAQKIR
jgi:hypothetical protein